LLQVPRREHVATQHLSDHPELLIPLLWLQPVQGQNDSAVRCCDARYLGMKVVLAGSQQGEIHLEQVLDVPFRDLHRCLLLKLAPDLLARSMLPKAQMTNAHHHIEPVP
jgi:hypothetical protein